VLDLTVPVVVVVNVSSAEDCEQQFGRSALGLRMKEERAGRKVAAGPWPFPARA
jgi:hypothetical protein